MMDEEEMNIPPIMTLPKEVRSLIFNLIPQNETVNLRLICKTWDQEIQDNYEYDIMTLDEDSPNFKSIIQLRIKTLKIHKLEITSLLTFDGTCIFKHPNAIRTLVIRAGALVPQLNLQLLLGRFSDNLLLLVVHVTPKICNYQFPSDLSFNFKHLKRLSIDRDIHDDSEQCKDNPRSLFHLLENSTFPKLKSLRVLLSGLKMTDVGTKSRIAGDVFRLISKHGRYLEDLLFCTSLLSGRLELPVRLQEEELLRIKEIRTLKRLSLDRFPVNLGITQFWSQVIVKQNQLNQLRINLHELSLIESVTLIEQIISNNSATLEKLEIVGIRLSFMDEPFDLSIFKNSPGLKTLKFELDMRGRGNLEEPDVVNLHCLPENITELILSYFKVSSEELLIAFRPNNNTGTRGFNNLRHLSLKNCGNEGPVGINAVVLYEIMMTPRPSLTNVDFRGTVHQGGAALKTVLNQLQLCDDTDFRLKRDSGELGWRKWW